MAHGSQFVVSELVFRGLWFVVRGSWFRLSGPWFVLRGLYSMVLCVLFY